MTLIPQFFHRRSLTVAAATLPVSFVTSLVFMPIGAAFSSIDQAVYVRAGIASGFAMVLCFLAWFNLVRDVERGYAPWRCSLAAVLLLGASIWPACVFASAVRHLVFA
jgi:hypothetical protein